MLPILLRGLPGALTRWLRGVITLQLLIVVPGILIGVFATLRGSWVDSAEAARARRAEAIKQEILAYEPPSSTPSLNLAAAGLDEDEAAIVMASPEKYPVNYRLLTGDER